MNQTDKAKRFAELHVKGAPLLLYNAWDAGSAKSILAAGAQAITTSSWSVAEAQGYRDGEAIPIALAEQIVARIVATIDAPVTVDFEGGYSEDDGELADNVSRLLDLGVIGINFEDRVVKGSGLYSLDRQARASPPFAKQRSRRASISSSTPARMCFSNTAKTQPRPSAKLSTEPRRMRLLARQASSSPA
jgi:2-methylisocitrate lyase-like PEP mutase family enzyme